MSIPRKRARTNLEKRELMHDLLELWLEVPDLRLGQLLSNAICQGNLYESVDVLFTVEDAVLLDAVLLFVRPNVRRPVE